MHDSKALLPRVPIVLHLPPVCVAELKADNALYQAVKAALAKSIDQLLVDLGVPARSEVSLQALNGYHSEYPARERVHDSQLRSSTELLARIHSYVQGVPLNTETPLHVIAAWLQATEEGYSQDFLTGNHQSIVEFLSLVGRETIKQQPSVLLNDAVVDAIQQSLLEMEKHQPASWLRPILGRVLDLRLSLADSETVARVLGNGIVAEHSQAEIAENLIVALRPDVVEIRVPEDYLRELTLADATEDRDTFDLLRDGLFYELGLTFPDFRFVPTDDLKPGTFAFRINHLTTLPYVGLDVDQCVVNALPETLKDIGVIAQPTVNPANWNTVSLVDTADITVVRENGYWIWDPVEYLVLALSSSLRENGAVLLDTGVVEKQLSDLAQIYPTLIQAVKAKFTIPQLTRIERSLVAENLSVRDLRQILERLLDYDHIVVDPRMHIIADDRIAFPTPPDAATLAVTANLTRFVRMGMKRYVSHRALNQGASLGVYLIDTEFEAAFFTELETGTVTQAFSDRILDALEEAFHLDPLPATPPSILVSQMLRTPLREITTIEFPRLRIWAYEELSSSTPIRPIARILL